MEREAQYDCLVHLNDSDVRVEDGYFRRVVEPLRTPKFGGVTCFVTCLPERLTGGQSSDGRE